MAPPVAARRALITGSAKAAFIAMLSVAMMSAGVLLGTPIPVTALASQPGTASAMAGTSGSAAARVVVVTANGRNLPLLIGSIAADMGSNMTCACASIMALSAGPPAAELKTRGVKIARQHHLR